MNCLRLALCLVPLAGFAQLAPPNAAISAVVGFNHQSESFQYFADAETTARETSMVIFTVSAPLFGSSAVAAFCVELEQTIGTGTHPFRATSSMQFGSRGSANAGTPTYGMPTGLGASGGIGATRAARINRLFQQAYAADPTSSYWTSTLSFSGVPDNTGVQGSINVPYARIYAFQLAVWSLAFSDTPGFLGAGGPSGTWGTAGFLVSGNPNDGTVGGTFRVPTANNVNWNGADGSNASGRPLNAIKSLAQAWINDAVANPVAVRAVALLNDTYSSLPTGSATDLQDLLVPEPSTYAAIAGALALFGVVLRRRR